MERGRFVILTAMPEQMHRYWLNAYFPVALSRSIKQMPSREAVTTALDAAGFKLLEIEPWAVPPDPSDLFLYSGKHRPELYLDPDVRKGISTFARLASAREVEAGLTRLRSDLGSGHFVEVAARYEHDGGDYSFVLAEKMGTRQESRNASGRAQRLPPEATERWATAMPASTTTPPRPCKGPRGSLRISQASTAAATGCNSRLTEVKAAGRWASA